VTDARRTQVLSLPAGCERVVALGDPHGDLAGLELVLAREAGPKTAIVSVGDNIGYADGPTSSEFCRRLVARSIQSVFGNHEAWMGPGGRLFLVTDRAAPRALEPDALAFCTSLPYRLRFEHEGLKVSIVHTLGEGETWDYVSLESAGDLLDEQNADVVICGHSHGPAIYSVPRAGKLRQARLDLDGDQPLVLSLERGVRYVVDAGSLGRPGHHPLPGRLDRATWAVLDLARRSVALQVATKPIAPTGEP
jgi:predicted phosphodiesterase